MASADSVELPDERLKQITSNFDELFSVLNNVESDKMEDKKLEPKLLKSKKENNKPKDHDSRSKSRSHKKTRKKESSAQRIASLSSTSQRTGKKLTTDIEKQSFKRWTREFMWQELEDNDATLDNYPRPTFGKNPNFKSSGKAAQRLAQLQEFHKAKVIKVGSAMSVMPFRKIVLQSKELIYSNIKDLKQYDFIYCILSKDLKSPQDVRIASTKKGLIKYGTPMRVGFKSSIKKIDMMVVPSVVVSTNGVRIGTGKGLEDLEWGMLFDIGAVTEDTVVVTIVADEQVVTNEFLPLDARCSHDLPVNIICTPSRILRANPKIIKPTCGINPTLLNEKLLEEHPALQNFNFS
uniref:Methenyltetrahydrofolate synthetase domain-containing protein n=1 Tax=Caligus clemensi TaxID=344056 RepID=C1C2B9_CALCM|nr:Methenyltetrahydrofolate synthetase domain-containing protein [Caligus clemensi]